MSYKSPWPSPIDLWADPPWHMTGKCLTAWFETDIKQVEKILTPSFIPKVGQSGVVTRLRFYDINYSPVNNEKFAKERHSGRFKEAVVAFAGEINGIKGEYSAFMWTDSLVYFSWGRENFGWPLLISDIELSGNFWDPSSADATKGRISAEAATLELTCQNEVLETLTVGQATNWLTPRRILYPHQKTFDKSELLIVRPIILDPGTLTSHRGEVHFSAATHSILAGLQPLGATTIHQHSNFLLSVGKDVESIPEK
ncbi:MAG: acetoacetate decarboxylase family protein [Actinobacteria bacterium]|nr:acetoacetate decarboxylase family protein [Actinomycetota bacterium]